MSIGFGVITGPAWGGAELMYSAALVVIAMAQALLQHDIGEFIRDNPGEIVAIISIGVTFLGGVAAGIGAIIKWLTSQSEKRVSQSEKRVDQKIKLLASGQTEQSDRLDHALRLSDALYDRLEGDLERARQTEIALREQLVREKAEQDAMEQALHTMQTKIFDLEYKFNVCRQKLAQKMQELEYRLRLAKETEDAQLIALEQSEEKNARIYDQYQKQLRYAEGLKQQVDDLWVLMQDQSTRTEHDRLRLAAYDDAAYDADTRPLGTIGSQVSQPEEPENPESLS